MAGAARRARRGLLGAATRLLVHHDGVVAQPARRRAWACRGKCRRCFGRWPTARCRAAQACCWKSRNPPAPAGPGRAGRRSFAEVSQQRQCSFWWRSATPRHLFRRMQTLIARRRSQHRASAACCSRQRRRGADAVARCRWTWTGIWRRARNYGRQHFFGDAMGEARRHRLRRRRTPSAQR